jgi:putative N6-adenine-specific DNA methylase
MIAKTFAGLEPVLARELQRMGAHGVVEIRRGVRFVGDTRLMYKANLCLRTALRILVDVKEFPARNEHQLYNRVQEVDWSEYMDVVDTFAVDGVTFGEVFRHSKFASLKVKDAIADQFRKKIGRRPSVSIDRPNVQVHLHVSDNICSLSLDSSGESLHKRGYRQGQNAAPMSEVLAAGMLMIAGWNGKGNFIDPMCGSGTLLTEAGLMAANIAPGSFRERFGFQGWRNFDEALWNEVVQEAKASEVVPSCKLYGSDKSPMAIRVSERNLEAAGLLPYVTIDKCDFATLEAPEGGGLLITNPPYGERMKEDDLEELYRMIGDSFKQRFKGYSAWIISANMMAMKKVGLKANVKKTLFNGPLECRFHHYDLY